jgi:cytoskeletal protein CcmA (bactofilin family)
MAEQIIDVGTAPNNGTGDPLRTAFIKTDNNFDQIWAAGPVGSNVRIQNNVVSTLQVNQDLALSPNGVGNVRLNNNTIPGANNTWFLGSTTNQWRGVYANSITAGNVTINNNLVVPGDVTIEGNLTVEGDTIQIGNIVTDTKTIQLSNTASTANAATGSGITVGANDNIATLLYNSASNVWTTNIGVTATGNITAPYFVGNGALLTGITSYSNANATSLLASFGSNTISTTGNITAGNLQVTGSVSGSTVTASGNVAGGNILTAGIVTAAGNITGNYFFGNGSQLTGLPVQYGNANVVTLLAGFGSNALSTTGNISGGFILGNGSQLTGLPAGYANANAVAYGESGWAGNIVPSGNAVYSLGNATNQWNDLYVSNTTIFMNNVPITLGADNVLTVNGNAVLQNNSNSTISTTGNISGGNIGASGLTGTNTLVVYSTTDSGPTLLNPRSGALQVEGGASINSQLITRSLRVWDGAKTNTPTWSTFYNYNSATGRVDEYHGLMMVRDYTSNATAPNGSKLGAVAFSWEDAGGITTGATITAKRDTTGSQGYSLYVDLGGSTTATFNANSGLDVTGNITANYFVGNGSQLTGLAATYGNSNVANYLPTFSGNISAGNVSATGNISGAYIKGNGSELTNLPAPTVTQDISSTGAMSIMTYDGVIKYVNYATVEPSSGNITGGNISTTGNVTANYFIGDGSQLTNLPGGNATLPLANGTSNFNIATANGSANITANAVTYTFGTDSRLTVPAAANVPGKISALTAATGRGHDLRISAGNTNGCSVAGGDMYLSAGVGYGGVGWGAGNVNIVTGDRYSNDIGNTWRFDFFGNLTLPGNTFAVNYANGTPVSIGGGGNTGNVTFNDVNIIGDGNLRLQPDPANASAYLDVYLTAGPDIHIAGNGETVILGTDDFANVTVNVDGNVSIQASNGTPHTWTFDTAGNLNLPGNTIAINYLNGNLAFGTVTFNNEAVIGTGTSNTQSGLYLAPDPVSLANDLYLRVRGNILDEPTHIHFDTGNNQYYNQFIGDDNKYVQLANTGNIVINTNDNTGNTAQWIFDNFGTMTLPGGSRLRPLGANLDIFAGAGSYVNLITTDESTSVGVDGGGGYITTAGGTWDFDTTGNLTFPTGNLVITPDDPAGNIAFITSTDHPLGILSTGANGAVSSLWVEDIGNVGTSNIAAVYANPTPGSKIVRIAVGQNGSPGPNLWDFDSAGNLTVPGNIIMTTGIVGSGASPAPYLSGFSSVSAINISASANISASGNVTAANFFGNGATLSNVATQVTGSWTVPVGNSTQSFTVSPNETYYLWVDCNIPNGILAWNATATVTNTNVPVVGAQYAWVYSGGGTPIDFTSIPDQFVGTANTIVRSSVAPSATTNRFDFGLNNTSGNSVVVNYGYAKIS